MIVSKFLQLLASFLCLSIQKGEGLILQDEFRKIPESFIPNNVVYATISPVSRMKCMMLCQIENACYSVQYLSMGFTCELSSLRMVVSPIIGTQVWDVYIKGQYRYELVKTLMTWGNGKQFCENKNGHLAVILSQTENDYIKDGLEVYGINPDSGSPFGPWLGADDIAVPNEFRWVTGVLLTGGFENWMENNPDGQVADENCVHMGGPPNVPLYQWNDYFCTSFLWTLCQYE